MARRLGVGPALANAESRRLGGRDVVSQGFGRRAAEEDGAGTRRGPAKDAGRFRVACEIPFASRRRMGVEFTFP